MGSTPDTVRERRTWSGAALLQRLRYRPSRITVALALILAVGLGLRIVYPFGIIWVDSFTYADAAISMARWEPVFTPHIVGDVYYTQYVRLTLIAPTALLYKLFGESDVVSALFPLAMSLAMVPLAFWFTRRYANVTAGLAAAALVAIYPWSVIVSTLFMPDVLVAAFLAIATVCLLVALYDEGLSRRQLIALWFGVGAAFAFAFYARATAICVLPGFALVGMFRWRQLLRREVLAALAGGVLVLALFQVLLVSLGSRPFEDFRVLLTIGGRTKPQTGGWGFAEMLFADGKFWPFTVAGALGVVAFLTSTRPRAILRSPLTALAVITLFAYIYFEFFMDLPGTPTFRKEQRYILPLAFPILVFGGIGAGRIIDLLRTRSRAGALAAATVMAALLLFATVRGLRDEYGYWVSGNHRVDAIQNDIVRFLNSQPEAPVYVYNDDFAVPLSTRMGSAGTQYERAVSKTGRLNNRFDANGGSVVTPGSYVVILPVEQWWALPTAPAEDWTKVYTTPDGTAVYHVGEPPADAFGELQPVVPVLVVGGARLVNIGLTQDRVTPARHVGIELNFVGSPAAGTVLPLALRCGGELGTPNTLQLPAGVSVVRSDVALAPPAGAAPGSCDIVAQADAGGWTRIGVIGLPAFALTQVQDLAGSAAAPGWEAYAQPFLSGGAALLGRQPALTLRVPIPAVEAGHYWVDLLIYDYGSGQGTVTATLNGAAATTTWGSSGPPGVVHVTLAIPEAPAGSELSLTFERGDQPAVLLDAVALTSERPPGE